MLPILSNVPASITPPPPPSPTSLHALPLDVWDLIVFPLDLYTIKSAVVIDKSTKDKVLAATKVNALNLTRHFIQHLIDTLDPSLFSSQINTLNERLHTLTSSSTSNLRMLKEDLLRGQEQLIDILKTLPATPLRTLRVKITGLPYIIPPFMENIFKLTRLAQRLDQSQLLSLSEQRERKLRKIFSAFLTLGYPQKAFEVTHLMPNEDDRGEMAFRIVTFLVSKQDFEKAFQVARTLATSQTRAAAVREVCRGLIDAQKIDRAVKEARTIEVACVRAHAFKDSAHALITLHNNIPAALQILEEIAEEKQKGEAQRSIVHQLITGGTLDLALQVVLDIGNVEEKSYALGDICRAFIKVGASERALSLARTIRANDEKARVLGNIFESWKEDNSLGYAQDRARCTFSASERELLWEFSY